MTYANALRLADQTILQLRRHQYTRCVWLTCQGDVVRTPNTDDEVANMTANGAELVGVFGPDIKRQDLAEAIMETAGQCPKCGGPMRHGGIAMESTYTGEPDFIGGEVVTLSAGGPGRLVECGRKCGECGHSET